CGLVAFCPRRGYVRHERGVRLDGSVSDPERLIGGAEGQPYAALVEVLRQNWRASQDSIERRQPLLTVHDQELGDTVAQVTANLTGADLCSGLPEHQRAHRVAAVHRVE